MPGSTYSNTYSEHLFGTPIRNTYSEHLFGAPVRTPIGGSICAFGSDTPLQRTEPLFQRPSLWPSSLTACSSRASCSDLWTSDVWWTLLSAPTSAVSSETARPRSSVCRARPGHRAPDPRLTRSERRRPRGLLHVAHFSEPSRLPPLVIRVCSDGFETAPDEPLPARQCRGALQCLFDPCGHLTPRRGLRRRRASVTQPPPESGSAHLAPAGYGPAPRGTSVHE